MNIIDLKVNFKDARGEITDLIDGRNINAITLITFVKGAIRGNHFHKNTTQWNYLLKGKVKLFSKSEKGEIEESILLPGNLISTEPMEAHALEAIDNSELLVFTEGPRGGEQYESDTFSLKTPLV